jgi:CheY-like chemotaxis protein
MVTTQNEAQDNEAAEKAGVDFIMQKPFNEESLGETINKALKP